VLTIRNKKAAETADRFMGSRVLNAGVTDKPDLKTSSSP
jgi:hypothetical protein